MLSTQGDIQKSLCQPDFKVKNDNDNPLDTVSCIVWNIYNESQNLGFFVGSWDGFLRYYQIKGSTYRQIVKVWEYFYEHPVVCCTLSSHLILMVGLANGSIFITDFRNSANNLLLGNHDSPICSIVWIQQQGVLASFGFDCHMKIWTMEIINNKNLQIQYILPEKTFAISYSFPFILVCSALSRIHLYDVRNIQNLMIPKQYENINVEKTFKFSSCSICSSSGKIMLGGIDGRIVYLQFSDYNKLSFNHLFTAKSQKQEFKKLLGQVNGVQIEKSTKRPLSIACGTYELHLQNLQKRKIFKYYKSDDGSAITTARIHPNCEYIAYATGNDWTKGLNSLQFPKRSRIYLIVLKNSDQKILMD